MTRLLLVNPNTSADTTGAMVDIARGDAPPGVTIEGATAPFGHQLITDEAGLAVAAAAVRAMLTRERIATVNAVVVSAFGDPALPALQDALPIPAVGIAEAAMAEAARLGPFAVVTTTPALVAAIGRRAAACGHGAAFRGVYLTPGDAAALTADPDGLLQALEAACNRALAGEDLAALVIGGGPLARAARALRARLPVAVIEPIPAAVRLALARISLGR